MTRLVCLFTAQIYLLQMYLPTLFRHLIMKKERIQHKA